MLHPIDGFLIWILITLVVFGLHIAAICFFISGIVALMLLDVVDTIRLDVIYNTQEG